MNARVRGFHRFAAVTCRAFAAALALAFVWLPAAGIARPWSAADVLATGTIDSVEISPSGAILFDLTRADLARNAFVSTYLVREPDGTTRSIAAGLDVTEAHWSPDGTSLAFTASGKDGAVRLYAGDALGGTAHRLDTSKREVQRFAWSPNGRTIAVVATAEAADTKAPLSYWFDPDEDVLAGTPPARELWLVDARGRAARRLDAGDMSYGGPVTDHDPSWSADGTRVAVVRQPTPRYADFERQEFVAIDVRTGAVSPLEPSKPFALPDAAAPAYSHAGSVVTVHTWDGTFAARQDVYVDGRDVSASLDRDFWSCGASRTAWSGDAVLATAMDATSMRLFRLAPGVPPSALTPAEGSVEAFAPATDGSVVLAYSTPSSPPELYRLSRDGAMVQLTHVNALPRDLDVAPTSALRWTNANGDTLVGQYTAGGTGGMLVTELHGGPQCADDSSFAPFVQYFATNGYAYLRPSPRGSDGYGDWSYKAIIGDWGAGPMDDALRGVDAAVAEYHLDPSRLFLYGASYGGYLTTWTIGHTQRFHAAVAGIPVTDLALDYELSESPNITRRFFGRKPLVDHPDLLAEESPIRYAQDVHTPVLLFAGLHDTRAPYPQAVAYYKSLAEHGVDVRLLAYPNEGHGPGDPAAALDWLEHLGGWFAAHDGLPLPDALRH